MKRRKPIGKRVIKEDESKLFKAKYKIIDFINETLLDTLGKDFHFKSYETHAVFY